MKIPIMAATLVLATACTPFSFAQNQSMPGMDMPAKPEAASPARKRAGTPAKARAGSPAKERSGKAAGRKAKPADAMGGMAMDAASQTKASPQKARPAGSNAEDSMPGMDMGKGSSGMQGMHTDSPMTQAPQNGANGSITHDTMHLQEPENPAHTTGSNLPPPDLLKEVVSRPAIPLEEFLGMADKNNPTLAQARALVERSGAQARQAGLYPNPAIGYEGDQIRGGQYGGGEQGAYLQQTIVLGGKLGLRQNIYNQQKQSDQFGVEEQSMRIHRDVMDAFYTALTSQSTVVLRQHLLGVATDAVETVHQLANVGQADSPDILQAEVEAEQAKIDYVMAQREFLQNFGVLAAFAGRRDLPVSPLAGSLDSPPEIDAEQQVETIVNSSPLLKKMQQEVSIEEARLRNARRELIPDLTVRAGEQYNFEHITEHPVKATGPQSFAQVGINLPLWNRNQGNIGVAQADLERSKQEVLRTQLALKQMAEPLAQTYLSARFTADRYRTELIPRAERAYQLYLTKYGNMAMAYPQVLVSQRTLFQLRISYLSALHQVWTNAVALQNFGLSGGLNAPASTGSSAATNLPYSSGGVQ